jgi:hypothetical protein
MLIGYNIRSWDQSSERSRSPETQVVNENDQDVRSALGGVIG